MSEKVLGYSLITIGVGMILLAILLVWSVFSGKQAPPQLFNLSGVGFDMSQLLGAGLPSQGQAKSELISPQLINDPLNLTFYLLFMGFVVTAGAKIATIGTQLVRSIKVDLKTIPPAKV
ncbi:MAG: hypothetical protein Q7S31_02975 [bacterium]|nr:hypothetical protein [bacterium]